MKRAIRRHHTAKIKRLISREIDKINHWYDHPTKWVFANFDKRDACRLKSINRARRDEGRYVRQKVASGKSYFCGCEWCIDNWTYSSRREISRIHEEEYDYIQMGCPPDWGYDWMFWYEDFAEQPDYSWGDWDEYLKSKDITPIFI